MGDSRLTGVWYADSFNPSLESHLELEREGHADCAGHADGEEGLKAFVEKRKPIFGVNR